MTTEQDGTLRLKLNYVHGRDCRTLAYATPDGKIKLHTTSFGQRGVTSKEWVEGKKGDDPVNFLLDVKQALEKGKEKGIYTELEVSNEKQKSGLSRLSMLDKAVVIADFAVGANLAVEGFIKGSVLDTLIGVGVVAAGAVYGAYKYHSNSK